MGSACGMSQEGYRKPPARLVVMTFYDKRNASQADNVIKLRKEPSSEMDLVQITDKGFRTTVLSPLSYFTGFEKYGIIKV